MLTLQERGQSYYDKAKAALKNGDLDKAEQYKNSLAKVTKAHATSESLEELHKLLPGVSDGDGDGEMPTKMFRREEKEEPKEEKPDPNHAVYMLRYNEPSNAIKAVLTDLYGPEYWEVHQHQKRAFKSYLRFGEKDLSNEDLSALRQVVFTPSVIKGALDQDFDDVAALKATMVESVDRLGGFVVPVDFQEKIIERIQGLTVMRGRASVDQTSRDRVELPVGTGGDDQYTSAVRVSWVNETPTAGASDTNLSLGLEGVDIHTSMAETGLSRNLVEDAAFNIEDYLGRKFAESSAIDEDNQFLIGDGVGKPEGFLPGGTNALGLTERPSLHATELTWDGLISLMMAVPSQYRNNACWAGDRATYEAIMKLKSGDNYLWQPFQFSGGEDGKPIRLLGYEVKEQESMPSIAAGAYPLWFGDPGGYQIFDRVGMTVERFLDSATARSNMIYYVMRRRLGGKVTERWRMAVQKIAAS